MMSSLNTIACTEHKNACLPPLDSAEARLPPQVMPEPLSPKQIRSSLVLIPHPDDESIGCGGLIAKLAQQGTPVHLILVSDGAGGGGLPPGSGKVRQQEFAEALRCLGQSLTWECWQLPDGSLSQHVEQLHQQIQRALHCYKPDTLIAPWSRDLHPDHAVLGQAAFACQQKVTGVSLLFYEVWTPLPATHVLDITPQWRMKSAALNKHKTALGHGDYSRVMEALAAYRSLLSGSLGRAGSYAEAYYCIAPRQEGQSLPNESFPQIRYVTPEDAQSLSGLFARVFHQNPSAGWWQKKYADQPQAGTVAETIDGEIVGYYGAMYRQGYWQGKWISSAQQGDVMVAPEHRFATKGEGVFLRMSSLFLKHQLGQQGTYQFAYGFPTHRALKLGVRLGLYRQGDPLGEWVCQNQSSPMGISWRIHCQPCCSVSDWSWCDGLTPFMEEPEQTFWLKKDSRYWQQRFVEAVPQDKCYHLIRLSRWGRLQAVAIVHLETDRLEILDLAKFGSHPDANHKLISGIINYGESTGRKLTTAWGTYLAVDELRRLAERRHRCGSQRIDPAGYMALPSDALDAPLTEQLLGRSWMLGGDTDFR